MKRKQGFTLIEMLLVLVIVGSILWAAFGYMQQRTNQMRIDRATLQIQMIQNAALSYYVTNSDWPYSWTDLLKYLPVAGAVDDKGIPVNPWTNPYQFAVYKDPTGVPNFYVFTAIPGAGGLAAPTASIVAGTLPFSYTSSDPGAQSKDQDTPGMPPNKDKPCDAETTLCQVVSSINTPGQSLIGVGAVNYAGVYPNGGCVPAPICPTGTTPNIIVAPSALGGFVNIDNVQPISQFITFARGDATGKPTDKPYDCTLPDNPAGKPMGCGEGDDTKFLDKPANPQGYWRACVQIITPSGNIQDTSTDQWGQNVTIAAFTRCSVDKEKKGTSTEFFTRSP